MSNQAVSDVAYSLSRGPLSKIFPSPVVSVRAPGVNDVGYQFGQIWIVRSTTSAYILTNIVAGVATWTTIAGGGAGVFTSLTVNPGPTNLSTVGNGAVTIGNATNTGAVTISVGTGNFALNGNAHTIGIGADAAANTINIGNNTGATTVNINGGTAGAGAILIGSTANDVPVTIGSSTGVSLMTINGGTGGVTVGTNAIAHPVTVGSTTTTSTTTIQAGSGGVALSALGIVTMVAATDTQASPSATSVINANVGAATFTGFTTGNGAAQVFTITNSKATTTSQIFVTAANEGANDAQMTITRVKRLAGSFTVTLFNNGAAALNGNVTITFWIIG